VSLMTHVSQISFAELMTKRRKCALTHEKIRFQIVRAAVVLCVLCAGLNG
jgi:hypothetical protein